MKRFPKGKICLPIVEKTVEKALRAIEKASPLADLIELRLDYLQDPNLELLLNAGEKPCIVTNRRKKEGGKYEGGETERLAVLQQAIDLGAAFVDVEMESHPGALRRLFINQKRTKVILSFHDFQKTGSPEELRGRLRRMARFQADVVKIVTLAQALEDNLKVLSLIPYALGRKQKIIAFCMGDKGKMSRIFSPLLGAAWTYASIDGKKASAPGQLPAVEVKRIWEKLA